MNRELKFPSIWSDRATKVVLVVVIASIGLAFLPLALHARTTGTFRTQNLLVDTSTAMGGATIQPYPLNVLYTGTNSQAVVVEVDGVNVSPTPTNERQAVNARVTTTINTTAGPVTAMAFQGTCQSTRSAGANPLTNACFISDAQGGDDNLSFQGVHGQLENRDGFDLLNGGTGKGQIGSIAPGAGQEMWIQLQHPTTTSEVWLQEDDVGHVGTGGINEAINLVIRNRTNFNTGALQGNGGGIDVVVATSKVGANPLVNTAILADATGGDQNYALFSNAGDIRMNTANTATLGATTTTSLITGGAFANLSGSTNILLNQHVSSFAIQVANGQMSIGEANTNDGQQIEVKNTTPGITLTGISVGGDTTVEPGVRPDVLVYRGPGGIGASAEGGMAIASGSGFPFVGMAANDIGFFMEGGGDLYLGADNSTFVAALKIKSSDNSVKALHGPFITSGGQIISGATPTSVSHGALSADATNWSGDVTGIGANTSVVLTYSTPFPTGSHCQASPLNSAVAIEQITAVPIAASVTFTCTAIVAGVLANCDDFTYSCVGF